MGAEAGTMQPKDRAIAATDGGAVHFVLRCVRSDRASLFEIDEELDWPAVLQAAGRHGLLPLLWKALQGMSREAVPLETRQRLERWHRRSVGRSILQMAALREVAGAFSAAGLRAVCWKGPTLALALYGGVGERESGDLDLLVEPEELDRAGELLRALGFEKHRKTRTERGDELVATLERDLGFVRVRDAAYVELHTEIMPARFAAWQQGAWYRRRAVPMDLGAGVQVQVLRPEDLLLSLVAHGIKHHWEHLKWVQDLAQFVGRYRDDLDWVQVLQAARGEGKSDALAHALGLANLLMGSALPAPIEGCSELAATASLTASVGRLLVNSDSGGAASVTGGLMALLVPSTGGRLRFALRRAFEPQLRDFNDGFSRLALVCKWRRILRQAAPRDLLTRSALPLRRVR